MDMPDFLCTVRKPPPSIEKPPPTAAPPLWIGDVANTCHTGDIVLFSSKNLSSNFAKFFTQSEWDHVGIVVRPTPTHAYLVEWGGGLFASELVDRLTEYHEQDARSIVVRKLKLGRHRERQEDQMEEFIDMLFREQLGRNMGVPFAQVTRAARRQFAKVEADGPVIDDLTTLFCSKTVAIVYKSIGLIDAKRDAADFLPKHFAQQCDTFADYRLGASLGPEVRLTFESQSLRNAVTAFLALSGIDYMTGQSRTRQAALRIQRAARQFLGKRERERRRLNALRQRTSFSKAASAAGEVLTRALPQSLSFSRSATQPNAVHGSPQKSEHTTAREQRASLLRDMSTTDKSRRPRARSVYIDGMMEGFNGGAKGTASNGGAAASAGQIPAALSSSMKDLLVKPIGSAVGTVSSLIGAGDNKENAGGTRHQRAGLDFFS